MMINSDPDRLKHCRLLLGISLLCLSLILVNCRDLPPNTPASSSSSAGTSEPGQSDKSDQDDNPFSAFMAANFVPADGFESPIPDNQPQSIRAVANGRVLFVGESSTGLGSLLVIEHIVYENHKRDLVLSIYGQLDQLKIGQGAEVRRGQMIGTLRPGQQLYFRLRRNINVDADTEKLFEESPDGQFYLKSDSFIQAHRQLFVPQTEANLLLIDQERYRMQFYRIGQLQGQYDVSFGQAKGVKQVQGDRKTPKGLYFVVSKHRGEFPGPYGAYYGGHWIKINYPNGYDAARGLAEKLITPAQAASIEKSWQKRELTPQETRLGGGIGFHGWISEWSNDGPRHLSWGCVVLHNFDIEKLYDQLPIGTMVVIF